MITYHKIHTIFKRDNESKNLIFGEYSLPEFEYLANNEWEWTEKIDGTNCRILYEMQSNSISFGGRTDNAKMPKDLKCRLRNIFTLEKLKSIFPECKDMKVLFFGEGFGYKIQGPIGSKYNPEGVDFILFDVLIGRWWLKREDVNKLALSLGIKSVPIVGRGTLSEAIKFVQKGFQSQLGNLEAEGLILRPREELHSRSGNRIIAKLKHVDFK